MVSIEKMITQQIRLFCLKTSRHKFVFYRNQWKSKLNITGRDYYPVMYRIYKKSQKIAEITVYKVKNFRTHKIIPILYMYSKVFQISKNG